MRILIDMNLSPRWVDVLADAGIECIHWSSVGETTASDSFIMAFAKGAGYVVLTHDLDFGSILAATHGDKPSVIQIRSGTLSTAAIGPFVVKTLIQMEAEIESGALLTIEPPRARIRLLPLNPR
jgi:predicted nuclease of predicted toxin-antitoxin system